MGDGAAGGDDDVDIDGDDGDDDGWNYIISLPMYTPW